jgi:hypothetical protein
MSPWPIDSRPGQTYAITTKPFDGWVKIGRTGAGRDARARMRSCQTGNARPLQLRVLWPVDVEPALHLMYDEFRGHPTRAIVNCC